MGVDYYRVLGVIPGADEVVVRAAYRALAQRYHPDRFAGDPKEAHQRMAEINAAFAILGDPVKRAAYDAELRDEQAAEYASSETEWQQDQAFSDAMEDLDRRWEVACGVFPDLEDLKQELHRISSKLSFAFVTTVLESKGFQKRKVIASHLEQDFLRRYFGENTAIQDFAKGLITARKKEAARALNDLVSVLGADVDPDLLIRRIEIDFGLKAEEERRREEEERFREEEERRDICDILRVLDDPQSARRLAKISGFIVNLKGGGFFKDFRYVVTRKEKSNETVIEFDGEREFIKWVRSTLCKK